ncbi:MAG: hypothetical protein RMK84_15780 [Oscillochloridaceae bacterium]|nr:hypothetical protein [Chloroflexaceae bacterium]MDW8391585.1 hypothetical protein [Oscillochloridaceae bacterium]
MAVLPITRLVLFKHGVGYIERRGSFQGERLELSFPREATDDVLKSLIVLDNRGYVLGVDFETPEDRAARLGRVSIGLSEERRLLDLLRDLRGRAVRVALNGGNKRPESVVEGLLLGVDYEPEMTLRRATLAIYQPETRQVRVLPVVQLAHLDLLDDQADSDLRYALRVARGEEQRQSAMLRLSPGEHDLLLAYIAPAPAWRVSYRLLYEEERLNQPASAPPPAEVLLQGWGLFDNQLDEDLCEVELTLMAGMPISFRYRLALPHTPERPLVEDEERTVAGPLFFDRAPPPAPELAAGIMAKSNAEADAASLAPTVRLATRRLEEGIPASASGDERGALFAYHITHPVSVARGQSAMVPIVSRRLPARRELLYSGAKHPRHPVAALRFSNVTGLTLERGPVTVLENGDYAGEAVLPFTRAGDELIVPYAVELGIEVTEERRGERRTASVRLEGEYLRIEEHESSITDYELVSALDRAVVVTLEHARNPAFEVVGPRPPEEERAGFARWRVPCEPRARIRFTVTERRLLSRFESVRGLTGEQLREFLADRLLDVATVKALGAVLRIYQQINAAREKLQQLGLQRDEIYKRQRQIRSNLEPLGREGEEGVLRQRYVATLNELENRLAALAEDEAGQRAEIARLEEQAARILRG